jgi:uncharacterized protein YcbK (DUF882 family)
MNIDRRHFLKFVVPVAMTSLFPRPAIGALGRILAPKRALSLYNAHTEESIDVCYYLQGRYQPMALKNINYILRDHRSGEIKSIDTNLLDLLYSIKMKLDTAEPFHIISGYRSPDTNEYLHRTHKGVAKNSLHMYGRAIDFRLPDIRLSVLRKTVENLKAGGVGYYPRSNFIHIDVGPIRCW